MNYEMGELTAQLPELPTKPEIDEECGEECWPGFQGDISQCAEYVTDGHLLLWRGAIDPAMEIRVDEYSPARRYATEAGIQKVREQMTGREDVEARLIGTREGVGGAMHLAFLRDVSERWVVVDALLLAFCVRAVNPDLLTVSGKATSDDLHKAPVALWRDGALVGMLMPMRFACDGKRYWDTR